MTFTGTEALQADYLRELELNRLEKSWENAISKLNELISTINQPNEKESEVHNG